MAVLLETSLGIMTIDLYPDECPLAAMNFLKLCKLKYYNGCVFHTVQKDFLVQTGDPTGTGSGGDSVYKLLHIQGSSSPSSSSSDEPPSAAACWFFGDEIHPKLKHDRMGIVAMANAGPGLNASQFYITTRAASLEYLDGKHTIFGVVAEGQHVLMRINEAMVDDMFRPFQDIRIINTEIVDDPFDDPPELAQLILGQSSSRPPPFTSLLDSGVVVRLDDDWVPMDERFTDEHELERYLRQKQAHSRAVVLEMIGDIPEATVKPPENVLFIRNLNPITEEADLEIIASRFGNVRSVDIIRDRKTGESLCYGFIEFEAQGDCEDAYEKMGNVVIDDRRVCVDFSQSVSKVMSKLRARNMHLSMHSKHRDRRHHHHHYHHHRKCSKSSNQERS